MRYLSHVWTLMRRAVVGFGADQGTQLAAAISYYVLFSIFPLAIAATSVLGLVLRDEVARQDFIDAVVDTIPVSEDEGRQEVTDIIEGIAQRSSGAFGVVGLLGLLWSGSAVFGTVRRSLNAIYGAASKRPLVRQKLTDFAMMAGLAAFFLASIAATAMLQAARDVTTDYAGIRAFADFMGPGWDVAAFVIPMLLSLVGFSTLYWAVPAVHVRWRDVLPGAIFASIAFEALKLGFSLYVANFGNYDVVFGSLAAVLIFLFWVFLAANIMLFGAEIASEHGRVMRGDYDTAPDPGVPQAPLRTRLWRVAKGLVVQSDDDHPERHRSRDRPS